ncbi:DNA/RNA non-specific endonuclease [Streptomyces sp. NPDC046465]|uniref:DNA/RNA non-specific endonuclease n=1 Tax=Streptomyces sp. NPDC046465 TaxID=3155810 RepID=UPI0033D13852
MTLLTAVTLGLTASGTSWAQQKPTGEQGREGRLRATEPPAAAPRTEASSLPADFAERCEPTRPGSKERRAGAAAACVRMSPAPARRTGTPERNPASAANAGSCAVADPGTYSYERFAYCLSGVNVLYTLRDSTGKELGRGTLTVSTTAPLPAAGTAWSEQITATMSSASGAVTALNAKFRASCTTGCTATKTAPWYGGDVTPGQSLNGTVTYSSNPAPNTHVQFTTSYKMYVTSSGATPVDPNASWDNPRKIRCDDAVGGTSSAGCAIPSVRAVVPLSARAADPGGAVAAYAWAQKNLNGAWGKPGSPLIRSTSGVADRTARTCSDFTDQTELVDADSCGDFPFGEAKEGGAPGDQCAEVIPNLGNGAWDTYVLNDGHVLDPASPCVQAHVTPAEQQFADTQLANGFRDQRVIDADQFEVRFTTPSAGPQGRCLGTTPDDALPSGDGWIRNTTEPVDHVNKTTTPLGPAGKRPTLAQACLGKTLGKGSEATGDITGWQDAQLFAQAHPPAPGQARCHLVANILGGKGRIKDGGQKNLVPCWQVGMNTGTPSMRTYEAKAQKKVPDDSFGKNDAIFYQVTPVYRDATSTIPVGVTMSATIERADGTTEVLFPDVYITNTQGTTGLLNLGN